jgi:hypothetical protein
VKPDGTSGMIRTAGSWMRAEIRRPAITSSIDAGAGH